MSTVRVVALALTRWCHCAQDNVICALSHNLPIAQYLVEKYPIIKNFTQALHFDEYKFVPGVRELCALPPSACATWAGSERAFGFVLSRIRVALLAVSWSGRSSPTSTPCRCHFHSVPVLQCEEALTVVTSLVVAEPAHDLLGARLHHHLAVHGPGAAQVRQPANVAALRGLDRLRAAQLGGFLCPATQLSLRPRRSYSGGVCSRRTASCM